MNLLPMCEVVKCQVIKGMPKAALENIQPSRCTMDQAIFFCELEAESLEKKKTVFGKIYLFDFYE